MGLECRMSVARSAGHERDFFDGLSFEEQDEQSGTDPSLWFQSYEEELFSRLKILFDVCEDSKIINTHLDEWEATTSDLKEENVSLRNEVKAVRFESFKCISDLEKELINLRIESNTIRSRNEALISDNATLKQETSLLVESLAALASQKSLVEKELEAAKSKVLNVEVANNHSLSASRTGSARLPTLIGAEEISNIPSFQSAAGQNKRVISSSETSRAPSRAGSRTARKSVVETEGRKPPVGKKVTKDAAETEGRGVKRGRSTRAQGRDKGRDPIPSEARTAPLGQAKKQKVPIRATQSTSSAKASPPKARVSKPSVSEREISERPFGRTPLRDRLRSRSKK